MKQTNNNSNQEVNNMKHAKDIKYADVTIGMKFIYDSSDFKLRKTIELVGTITNIHKTKEGSTQLC